MARIATLGFELQSVTAGVEIDATQISGTSTLTIDTTTKHGGAASLKAANTGAAANAYAQYGFIAANGNGPYYVRFNLYLSASVTGGASAIFVLTDSTTARKLQVKLTTTDTLELWDSAAQIGSDSVALAHSVWHSVKMRYYNNTTSGKLELELVVDGVTVATTTTSTNTGGIQKLEIGPHEQTGWILYYDNIAVNDTTGSNETGYPGEGLVIMLKPNAAGDANTFATAVGGTAGAANNYTRVNQVPTDDVTSYNGSNTLNQTDMYKCGASGLQSTDVVNVVHVGVRFNKSGSSTGSAFKVQIEKAAAGTKAQSVAITPSAQAWVSNANALPWGAYPITEYLDPDGVSKWTQATLDTMQIGMIVTSAQTRLDWVTGIYAVVDYTPTTVKTITGIARITAVTTKTIAGISRVTATTVKTIAGVANILLPATVRTITGISRITATTLHTIAGVARVTVTTVKTIPGVSRIGLVTQKTITGISRVTAITTKTIAGLARVTATTTKTITGLSRITIVTQRTISGLSRVTTVTNKTIAGLARITATTTKNITGVARVTATTLKTLAGKSSIAMLANRTITGVSRVTATTLQTISAKASKTDNHTDDSGYIPYRSYHDENHQWTCPCNSKTTSNYPGY